MDSRLDPRMLAGNLESTSPVGTPLSVLFLTSDLFEADYLAYELRGIAPNLRLDVSPRIRHAFDRLKSGDYDAVLVDQCISRSDRLELIAHIRHQKLPLPTIFILGADEQDSTNQMLRAGADECIVKGPNFINELPLIIQQALLCYQSGVRRGAMKSLPTEMAQPPIEEPRQEPAARTPALSAIVATSVLPGRQPTVSDRRGSPRREVFIPCRLAWQENSYDACIRDLSEGGAFLETSAPVPVDAKVVIFLFTANAEVRFEAVVTHCGRYLNAVRNFHGFGVRLCNLISEASKVLKELRSRSSEPARPKAALEP
jgi:CheY-like chemotaxis protein